MHATFKTLGLLAGTISVLGVASPAFGLTDLVNNDQTQVQLGGRLQLLGFGEQLQSEPFRSSGRLYLFDKASRLEAAARQGDYRLYMQMALGGEDVFTTNTNLSLLDMYASGPFFGLACWRAGQFKVPYGRELMTDSGHLAFNDRSLVSPFFLMGRDVGAALQGEAGPVTWIGGIFTGGGRDVPQRYLPQILGIPLLAARVSVGDADPDPFTLDQHSDLDTDRLRYSVAANALFTRDSRVGHSTVLNIKDGFDKSLLLSSGWNPYIGEKDPVTGEPAQGQFWQLGVDGVVKRPTDWGTLSGEAEVNYGNFANTFGAVNALGGRAQAALDQGSWEEALRYAVLVPDSRFAVTNTTAGSPNVGQTTAILPDAAPIHELTLGFGYRPMGDRLKLTLDFPVQVGAPIVTEKGIGSYNLIDQPDQTSVLTSASNALARQVVFQVRGGLQYAF